MIGLHRNGCITVTENGVTRTIERVLPFAYDGYGQDDDWVRADFMKRTLQVHGIIHGEAARGDRAPYQGIGSLGG